MSWTETIRDVEEGLKKLAAHHMPAAHEFGVENLQRLPGGFSRETWLFDLRWTEGDERHGRACVMQRSPDGSLLETDRTVEFETICALHKTDIPVPKPMWLDGEGTWVQRPALIAEKAPGKSGGRFLLESANDDLRRILSREFVGLTVRLHNLEWKRCGLPVLSAPTVDTAAAVQIAQWRAVLDQQALQPEPILLDAMLWLEENQPKAERVSFLWGDPKFENILFSGEKITVILDWELAHPGDPMEDIAWAYRWFASTGDILPFEEYIALYEEISGRPVDRRALDFYALFTCVKSSLITLTGSRSFVTGRTQSNAHPLGSGRNLPAANMQRFHALRDKYEAEWRP